MLKNYMEKKKRGRPVQSHGKKEEIRSNIIRVAKRLFAEEGYDHISIRKIAQQAECAPRTIYYYFKNKRELLNHLWLDIFKLVNDRCEKSAMGVTDPVEIIRRYYTAYVQYWLENPEHFRVIFMNEDLDATETHDEKIYGNILEQAGFVTRMVHLIQGCIEQGVFVERRKEIIFQTLLLSAHGLSSGLITLREVPWESSTELIHSTLDALVSGIRKIKTCLD
ncbi:MAG: TetR/AcrR family transcriptional regulator [Desulfobacula sp.]|nr:TetR/AcrR family transcriptional regulator [Desulfobacula sp.]